MKEKGNEAVFLHKIVPGKAEKSFALYVAYIAGIPMEIVNKSQEILDTLNEGDCLRVKNEDIKLRQLTFFEGNQNNPIIEEIRNTDIGNCTPVEALNKIYKWKSQMEGE